MQSLNYDKAGKPWKVCRSQINFLNHSRRKDSKLVRFRSIWSRQFQRKEGHDHAAEDCRRLNMYIIGTSNG